MAIKTNLPSLSPARERFKTTIQLPSGGYVDPDSFPDGNITVFPWTVELDEWVVKRHGGNASKETILHDVFPKLCDLKKCVPDRFLLSEALLIWMVSRSIRNDQKVTFGTQCPACSTKADMTVGVPSDLELTGEKAKGYVGYDEVTLDDAKDALHVTPLTVGRSRAVITRPVGPRKFGDAVCNLAASIVSVNGGKPDTLDEACDYVSALSIRDYEHLNTCTGDLNPGVSTKLNIECDACKHHYQHALQFTDTFFR